jgi:spore maturation protein CgeB
MRNSIISLNFSNSVGSNQVKARVFEVCGAGGFLLTEDAPHLDEIYDVGSEIDIFKSKFEMLEKVRHYLSESSQRDKMAHLSYVRTLSQHTYESRIRMVLSTPFEKSKDMAIDSTDWVAACQKYKSNAATKFLKSVILIPLQFFLGEDRGFRAARKIVFSLSIFLFGEKTFSSASWVGIVFPGRG